MINYILKKIAIRRIFPHYYGIRFKAFEHYLHYLKNLQLETFYLFDRFRLLGHPYSWAHIYATFFLYEFIVFKETLHNLFSLSTKMLVYETFGRSKLLWSIIYHNYNLFICLHRLAMPIFVKKTLRGPLNQAVVIQK